MNTCFTERVFRDALGAFPTGIAVVTTVTESGERLGLTISSFNSVSLSPPLVLFSIARRALGFAAWQRASAYAINILGATEERLATRFGRSSADKWKEVDLTTCASGVPLLQGSLASFECVPYARHDGGDHEIFVGRVVGLRYPQNLAPLVFFRGQYCRLSPDLSSLAPSAEALFFQSW